MRPVSRFLVGAAALLALCVYSQAAALQAPGWHAARAQMTRAELESLLAQLEGVAGSAAYSDEFKERARYEADLLRARLRDGDFKIGDQIALVVEGEQALTNTFIVEAGPKLVLPVIGDVPLGGVLRSELEEHLRQHLSQYIVNPVVHAKALIRISVFGAVGNPGFHVAAADALLSDVLTAAGGFNATADLDDIKIERSGEEIWSGKVVQQALNEGRTLDQLSLQAGDRIVVGQKSTLDWRELRFLIIGLPGTIFAIYRLVSAF